MCSYVPLEQFQYGIILFNMFVSFHFPSEQYNPQFKKKRSWYFNLQKGVLLEYDQRGQKVYVNKEGKKFATPNIPHFSKYI